MAIRLFTLIGLISFFVPQVYLSDEVGFIGCYEDDLGKTIADAFSKPFRKDVPVLKCIGHCRGSVKRYAGVKYHSTHMNCYCGNVAIAEDSRDDAKCDSFCPGRGNNLCAGPKEITLYDTYSACRLNSCQESGTCEEVNGKKCKCSNNCTEDEIISNTSSAAVPVVVTIIIILMIIVIIFILIKWRRHIKGKNQNSEIRLTIFQALPETCSSKYSTIPDPYNYVDIDYEGSLDNQKACNNYSKMKPNGQYHSINVQPQKNTSSNSNYNHIVDGKFGQSSENSYSCIEKAYGHANILTRIRKDDTYNKLKVQQDARIKTASECLDDPEYNHTRSNPFCTNLPESKEYSHLAIVDVKGEL